MYTLTVLFVGRRDYSSQQYSYDTLEETQYVENQFKTQAHPRTEIKTFITGGYKNEN